MYLGIVSDNDASVEGGGIYTTNGSLSLDGTTVTGNTSATRADRVVLITV
jgi:predicted outer membrane repeat protein